MRRRFLLTLIGCAVILAGIVGTSAQTKMPQMKFRERTLKNGLRVLSVVDKSSPTVAINVWYHVGSKDDPDQRSGFASKDVNDISEMRGEASGRHALEHNDFQKCGSGFNGWERAKQSRWSSTTGY